MSKKVKKKLSFETWVSIEKRSNVSEIAASTLNSTQKVNPHYFQQELNAKMSETNVAKIWKTVFQNSSQNRKSVKRGRVAVSHQL